MGFNALVARTAARAPPVKAWVESEARTSDIVFDAICLFLCGLVGRVSSNCPMASSEIATIPGLDAKRSR